MMDTQGIERLVRLQIEAGESLQRLREIRLAAEATAKGVERLGADTRRTGRLMARSLADTRDSFDALGRSAREQVGLLGGLSRSFDGLRKSLLAVFSIYTLEGLTSQVLDVSSSYQEVANRVQILAGSMEEAGERQRLVADNMEEIQRIARETWAGIDETSISFFRLSNALGGTVQAQEQALAITEAVNLAFALSGSSARESANTMFQLTQAFSKGVLNGDEFRSVSEQGVRVLKALQNQTRLVNGELTLMLDQGVAPAIGDLKQLGQEGKLTTDILGVALVRDLAALREEFDRSNLTIERAVAIFRNEFTVAFADFIEQSVALSVAAEGIRALALNLDMALETVSLLAASTAFVKLAKFMAAAFGAAQVGNVSGLTRAIRTLSENFRYYMGAIERYNRIVTASAAAGALAATRLTGLRAAVVALNRAFVALGVVAVSNPVAAIAASAAAAVGLVILLRDRTSEYAALLEESQRRVQAARVVSAGLGSQPGEADRAAAVERLNELYDQQAGKLADLEERRRALLAEQSRAIAGVQDPTQGFTAALNEDQIREASRTVAELKEDLAAIGRQRIYASLGLQINGEDPAAFAEMLEEIIKKVKSLGEEFAQLGRKIEDDLGLKAAGAFDRLSNGADGYLEFLQGQKDGIAAVARDLDANLGQLRATLAEVERGIAAAAPGSDEAASYERLRAEIAATLAEQEAFRDQLVATAGEALTFEANVDAVVTTLASLRTDQEKAADAARVLESALADARVSASLTAEQLVILTAELARLREEANRSPDEIANADALEEIQRRAVSQSSQWRDQAERDAQTRARFAQDAERLNTILATGNAEQIASASDLLALTEANAAAFERSVAARNKPAGGGGGSRQADVTIPESAFTRVELYQRARAELDALSVSYAKAGASAEQIGRMQDSLIATFAGVADPIGQARDQLDLLNDLVRTGALDGERYARAVTALAASLGDAAAPITAMRDALDALDFARLAGADPALIAAMTYELREQLGVVTAVEEAQRALEVQTELLEAAYRAGVISLEEFKQRLAELKQDADEAGSMIADLKQPISNSLAGSLYDFAEAASQGKASFSDFAASVIADIGQMIARMLILQGIQMMLGGFGFSKGGVPPGMGSWSDTTAAPIPGGLYARGGAFPHPIHPFAAGGIVNRPTLFPFANGIGLMGEAGAEAILPLSRMSNGNLGVEARGGGDGGGFVYQDNRVFDLRGASVEAVQRLEKALAEDRATFELRAVAAFNKGKTGRMIK